MMLSRYPTSCKDILSFFLSIYRALHAFYSALASFNKLIYCVSHHQRVASSETQSTLGDSPFYAGVG